MQCEKYSVCFEKNSVIVNMSSAVSITWFVKGEGAWDIVKGYIFKDEQ